MNRTCILTDDLVQFLDLSFAGQEYIQLMPTRVVLSGHPDEAVREMKPSQLPAAQMQLSPPQVIAPEAEAFTQAFANISRTYSEIIVLPSSSGLTDSYRHAMEAAEANGGRFKVSVVDSGAIGIGLGVLVAAAAEMAAAGESAFEIKRHLMGLTDHVYALFCLKNLAYLNHVDLTTPAQALIGEMLSIEQIFYLNAGTLVPVQKVRNSRHLVESFVEFVAEFTDPRKVAIQQAAVGYQQEARALRERLTIEYPDLQIHEVAPSLHLSALLGPQAFGLYLWETES